MFDRNCFINCVLGPQSFPDVILDGVSLSDDVMVQSVHIVVVSLASVPHGVRTTTELHNCRQDEVRGPVVRGPVPRLIMQHAATTRIFLTQCTVGK